MGQSQFNKAYDINGFLEWGWSVNVNANGDYDLFHAPTEMGDTNSYIYFQRINSVGNVLMTKACVTSNSQDYFVGLSHSSVSIPSGYVSTGSNPDYDNSGCHLLVFKTNNDGDTIFFRQFKDKDFSIGYGIDQCYDSGFVSVGITYDTVGSKADIYILKTDSNGNELWYKIFGTPTVNDYGYCIFEAPNKNLIISGEKKLTATNWAPWIIITDSAGNLIDQKLWNTGAMYSWGGDLNIGLKNQIIKYGTLDTIISSGDFPQPTYVGELNDDFSFKWRTILNAPEQNAPYIAKQLNDSSIVLVGVKLDPIDSNGSHPQGWIVKLDKDGNFLWEHLYKYCVSEANYFADFQQLPDGGYIISGSTIGCDSTQTLMTNQDLWLVRLDENGCLVPGCITNAGTIEVGRNKIDIYPNPASDNINLNWWLKGIDNAQLIIYNLLGQPVMQQQLSSYQSTIDVSDFISGLYIITIYNGSEKLESKFLKE